MGVCLVRVLSVVKGSQEIFGNRKTASATVQPLPHQNKRGTKTLEAVPCCRLDFTGRYAYPSPRSKTKRYWPVRLLEAYLLNDQICLLLCFILTNSFNM